jgi:leader peptidase (prepilin peptidase)/N-methyltransferase
VYFIFFTALIVITFIDIDNRIIPNVISLPGILLFFVASFGMPEIDFKDSLLGILAGGGSLLFVAWLYEIVRKKTGMGGGDIKLLAMIGALIGWPGVLFTIYVASISGTFAGLLTMVCKRERSLKLAIPFGPFLSIGAICYVFFGDVVKNWYFTFLG